MKFKMPKYILYFLALILASCAKAVPSKAITSEDIRVLVFKDLKEAAVSGADEVNMPEADAVLKRNTITIAMQGQKTIAVNGVEADSLPIRFSSPNGFLNVNNRRFRGEIEITIGEKGLLVVNNLDIEMYLAGLINHEISSKWHIEVVKAQSVIARTYALYQKKKKAGGFYHVEGTVLDQVYSGSVTEDEASFQAVMDTKGEVLTYNGELALAVYHSNAGGYTEASKNVWAKDYPYLRTVESPYDILFPSFTWELSISSVELSNTLKNAGYKTDEVSDITPLEKTSAGRITKIRIIHKNGKLEITGEDLRKAIGYDRLKSTRFEIKPVFEGDGKEVVSFAFSGRGSGHGVGLSQWGAKGMAEDGYTYKEILKHYYKGVEIEKIY